MYSILRPLLFSLDCEIAHALACKAIKLGEISNISSYLVKKSLPKSSIELMGLKFANRVGLAAGFDKNGDYIKGLVALGFGFIEIGTVTPLPQIGNPRPRLFRLPEVQALINRMGFNNKGVDHLVGCIANRDCSTILGVNIGKNRDTPIEEAHLDYLKCLRKVFPYADYITINISSPNTSDLRSLQKGDSLTYLLSILVEEQTKLSTMFSRKVPMLVKIAPDLNEEEVISIGKIVTESGISGIIATNTTLDKETVKNLQYGTEQGGLSGTPLQSKTLTIIKSLRAILPPDFPIIGVGGIMSGIDAANLIKAGADMIQIYTGFVYKGPKIIEEAINCIGELK